AQMCANLSAGGAAINVLTRACGARVRVVDVGVAADLGGLDGIEHRKVRAGTDDLAAGPAMTASEVDEALAVGVEVAGGGGGPTGPAGHPDPWLVGVGEMGIGNTTAAAAVTACLTGAAAGDVVGRGTGLDGDGLARKREVVERAVARVTRSGDTRDDPLAVLREVGGLEIAAMAGAMIGAAARGALVLVDGFISSAAALAACRLCPGLPPYLVASHRSTEPGHAVVLEALGLVPLLDLEMRLGEGTGCALAIPIVRAAGALLGEMATFESAGISGPSGDPSGAPP
ncbi:MAG: nicotinate-nucleotide--dimethylbenzimidazole phosphoribosyltransferase, partial [Acidobacteriota bacterium]|nr:nicotinate-nucleotide--dimethylbenzimidazole phosphoribosyltransferase [Acidobacteriota bacterium]